MNIFIDNTGLHSAARCLEGRAIGESDIKGLLQLAVQLIFTNSIYISGFSPASVIVRTNSLRDFLLACGLEKENFNIIAPDRNQFIESCELAAQRAAKDIEFGFQLDKSKLVTDGPDLSKDERSLHTDHFHEFIVNNYGDSMKANYESQSMEYMSIAAPLYMMIESDDLWSKIKEIVRKEGSWSEGASVQLNMFLRVYHNNAFQEFLGTDIDGKPISVNYSPAIERAKTIRYKNETLLELVSNAVDDASKMIKRTDISSVLELPSLQEGLIRRSKGDPIHLIKEAINLRGKAQSFIPWLDKVEKNYRNGTSEDELYIQQELKELTSVLEKSFKKKFRLSNVLELTTDLGTSIPSIILGSVKKTAEWLFNRKREQNSLILTELSRDGLLLTSENKFDKEKLIKACIKHVK